MTTWHEEVAAQWRSSKFGSAPPVREPAQGSLTCVREVSGEMRLRVSLPKRSRATLQQVVNRVAPDLSPPLLVYSDEVREIKPLSSGFGGLPGKTDFTKRGKRLVKSAAACLERSYGMQTQFLTLTLAGSTPGACEALARWSAKVVQLLVHWLQYHAKGVEYVYCWELQKRGALHLHAALGHRDGRMLSRLRHTFRDYVYKMHEALSRVSGNDWFAREHGGTWRGFPEVLRSRIEPVRKSVTRYLAKYLSKGSNDNGFHTPSRWWGMSRSLRARVNQLRIVRVWKSSDWEALKVAEAATVAVLAKWEFVTFRFCEPFSPNSTTSLVYPDEELSDMVLGVCERVARNYLGEPVMVA